MSYQYEARTTPESQEASRYAMRGTFGFEFELLIPFTACDSYEAIRKPNSAKKAVVRKDQLGITLKLDEQSKMNAFIPASFLKQENAFKKTPIKVAWVGENMTIPEVVTDVMNCQLSQEELSQRLGAIAAWAPLPAANRWRRLTGN